MQAVASFARLFKQIMRERDVPCCHFGASILSSIHNGSDGSSIATPMLANVIEPAYSRQSE